MFCARQLKLLMRFPDLHNEENHACVHNPLSWSRLDNWFLANSQLDEMRPNQICKIHVQHPKDSFLGNRFQSNQAFVSSNCSHGVYHTSIKEKWEKMNENPYHWLGAFTLCVYDARLVGGQKYGKTLNINLWRPPSES